MTPRNAEQVASERFPTRFSTAVFLAKALLLQLRRGVQNRREFIRCHPQNRENRFLVTLAESSTALWTDPNPSEIWYQRGKIQNLRVAASRLHECVIPAGQVFSFWQQVGRASVHKGYVPGRMLQEGCMIPAIGGGLCQLSNALYQVALGAGCEIVERHPHSRVILGSATAAGRDATVAWNYIDLRFRANQPLQLQVELTATHLKVSICASTKTQKNNLESAPASSISIEALPIFSDHACESCGQVSCFRSHDSAVQIRTKPVTAFLLDAVWPEFTRYLQAHRSGDDVLAIPINGERWNRPQYAWPAAGFTSVHTATATTLMRAFRSRRLSSQGALRQQALLDGAEALARQLAKSLNPNVDEVCVSQSLLPFLWRSGVLGGRRVRILGYQLPASVLQTQLDRAAQMHPESRTLNDFRAEQWLIEAEDEALANAEEIVTPHAALAALFPAKALLLDWSMPVATLLSHRGQRNGPAAILFPCSTLGRKGAYELREALRGMGVRLILGGKVLEDDHFWSGFDIARAGAAEFEGIDLAVQPCVVEAQPRMLLRALAEGVPVITTPNSGLHSACGAQFVAEFDSNALQLAISGTLGALSL